VAKYKVLMIGNMWPDTTIEKQIVEEADAELIVDDGKDEKSYSKLISEADAIIPGMFNVTDKVLSAAKKCKIVAKAAVGYDNIDVAAATRHGVIVTNVAAADFCMEEVADQTLALILGVERRVVFLHQKVVTGKWMEGRAQMKPMFDLRGQTLGLVAFGAIARAVADRARPFGFKIIASDPYVSKEEASKSGVEMVDFDTLLRISDVISIHAPLMKSTYHMFDEKAFAKMKKTAYLINAARGGIVDQKAMYNALKSGVILAAGLDVLEKEPPDADDPILKLDNVIILPHSAGYAEGSYERARKNSAQEVVTVLQGKQPKNWVNRKELGK
jgi:D-3-phosphoglycerate dehydrogenase / 2-oxoglutarate reductase